MTSTAKISKASAGRTKVPFGDVVRLSRERSNDPEADGFERFVGLEHIDPGDLRIRRWGDIAHGVTFTNVFRPGQVLFGKRRAYQRKVAVADFSAVCSSDIYVFEPSDGRLMPELLPFVCQTDAFFEHAVGTSAGSLSPRTNWDSLANFEFALPPLDEQQRMVRLLKAADLIADRLLDLAIAIEMVLTSLSGSYFAPGLWPERRLDEVLSYSSDGPFGSKIKTEHYATRGARVIRLNNITQNRFVDEDKAFLAMDYFNSDLRGYEVHAGDVIVAGLGDDRIPAGRACVVPASIGTALNKADCFCLRPTCDLNPSYLAFFLNSPRGLAQSASLSQGTTRLRLNLGNIKSMKLPLPPYNTQEEIAEKLRAVMKAHEHAVLRRESATNNRGALLNSLIKGIA